MKAYVDLLSNVGYVPADHEKDFGSVLNGVHYVFRKTDNVHEYVQLVSYDGVFCEAVYELFVAQKNSGKFKGNNTKEAAQRGYQSVMATLARTVNGLAHHACRSHEDVVFVSKVMLENLSKK